MEKATKEGDSPVDESVTNASSIQSSMRHEESRMNERRPLRKAKYS